MGDFRISIKIWVRPPVTRVRPDTYVSNKAIIKIWYKTWNTINIFVTAETVSHYEPLEPE
jgi:hypothetical protein